MTSLRKHSLVWNETKLQDLELWSKIIIDAYDRLKDILFHVFKVSIQWGIFLDYLKIAEVSLIFKSGDKDNVSNYRPISILSIFLKVLERIMYGRVYNHLDSKGLLYEKQFSLKRNNSTEHAILQLTRDITNILKKVGIYAWRFYRSF